jgi:hypothetical protein
MNSSSLVPPLHVRVLRVFQQPTVPSELTAGWLNHVLGHNVPDKRTAGSRSLDLARSLVVGFAQYREFQRDDDATRAGREKRTTPFGDQFLAFVSPPAVERG